MYRIKHNIPTICIIALMCLCMSACAQTKKSKSTRKTLAKRSTQPVLIQATSQTMHAGREESGSTTEYRFVIVWNSPIEPGGFFWRGEESWQVCNVTRINNFRPLVVKNNDIPQELNYDYNDPGSIAYSAGDTLELYPITGGKHPMPDEVPKDKNNIIYYKEVKGNWMPLPVNKITKLPTVSMP